MDPVLAVHLVATFGLLGLIWTVQLVHYPLFARVGREAFPSYHHAHVKRITLVVAPLMLAEAATAALLLRPDGPLPAPLAAAGMALVVGVWLSTALLQVPCHHRLEKGFDPTVHRRLVRTNWIRTALWTTRAALLVAALVS